MLEHGLEVIKSCQKQNDHLTGIIDDLHFVFSRNSEISVPSINNHALQVQMKLLPFRSTSNLALTMYYSITNLVLITLFICGHFDIEEVLFLASPKPWP